MTFTLVLRTDVLASFGLYDSGVSLQSCRTFPDAWLGRNRIGSNGIRDVHILGDSRKARAHSTGATPS